MNLLTKPIDMSKVRTIVCHLPDGQAYVLQAEGLELFLEHGVGRICDTSDIDGTIHFFPRGHA